MRRAPLLLALSALVLLGCGDDDAAADGAAPDAGGDGGVTTPFPWSSESWDTVCGDGIDNDGNGYADCADFACSRNLAVTVCPNPAYESTPARCGDGLDNDGDGRADCADPDCAKNPFHGACPAPAVETLCVGGGDEDGDGLADCADNDCAILAASCADPRRRVLFDQTLDETAALGPNSDWIVDASGRLPSPSNPSAASDWAGSLSSFGFALVDSGDYLVESLVPWEGGHLSYGDAANPQDLAGYAVLVLVEPSRQLAAAEKRAVIDFVLGGGGLLLVANHDGADRDGNGWSAPAALDDLLDANPVQADPFGFRFDENDATSATALTAMINTSHPVLAGPHGGVDALGFYDGCTARLSAGSTAVGLIQLSAGADPTTNLVAGAATPGAGRVVFLTDSAVLADGTDSHGTTNLGHNSWDDPEDNAAFLLNAVAWLAE